MHLTTPLHIRLYRESNWCLSLIDTAPAIAPELRKLGRALSSYAAELQDSSWRPPPATGPNFGSGGPLAQVPRRPCATLGYQTEKEHAMEQNPERTIGSMGSVCRTYRFLPEDIPRLAEFDWNRLARRVFIDPVSGLIALMSPSSDHESYANGIDRMVDAMGRSLDTRSINLGSTRWRRPGDPENTGAEPDACYYLGETADGRARARRDSPEALAAFEAAHPPDLVVEVERSHADHRKPHFYREIGVPEMWRLELGPDGLEIEILDLKAPDGPAQLTASAILPLCTPDFVRAALELAVDGRLRELDDMIANAAAAEHR